MINIRNRKKEKIIQYMELKELRDRRCNEIVTQQGAEPAQGMSHSSSMPPVRACNADEDSERTPVLTLWGRHLSYETAGHPNRQGPCSAKAILHSFVITVFVY